MEDTTKENRGDGWIIRIGISFSSESRPASTRRPFSCSTGAAIPWYWPAPWTAEEEADGRRVMPVPLSGSVLRGVLDRLGLRPGHAGRPPAPSPVPRIQVVLPGRRFDVTSAWPFFAAEMEREFPAKAAEIASLCAVSSASASGGPERGGVMDRFRRFLPKGEEKRRPLSSEEKDRRGALAGAIGGEEPPRKGKMSPTDVLAVRNALGSGKVHRMNELTCFLEAEYKRRLGSVITRGPWTFRVHGKRVEVRSRGAVVTAPRALGGLRGKRGGGQVALAGDGLSPVFRSADRDGRGSLDADGRGRGLP